MSAFAGDTQISFGRYANDKLHNMQILRIAQYSTTQKERRRAQMRQKRLLLQSLCHKSTKTAELTNSYAVMYVTPCLLCS